MKDKLYYNNQLIHDMREYRQGGQSMAEIVITVPRRELTEELVEQSDVANAFKFKKDTPQEPTPHTKVVVATNKKGSVKLGVFNSDEFVDHVKQLKLNPDSIKQALDGEIKTHKGYSFSEE